MMFEFRFEGKEYRLEKIMLSEASAIQKVTGRTFDQWQKDMVAGDVECITALIWIARKREEPDLKFSHVDGDLFSFEPIDDEEKESEDKPGEPEPGKDDEPSRGPAGRSRKAASKPKSSTTRPTSGESTESPTSTKTG